MAEWSYDDNWGAGPYDDWYGYDQGGSMGNMAGWDQFTGWGDPTGPGSSGDTDFTGEGSGGWLSSVLGSLGGLSGVLGPALSAGGAIAGGAIGSNAASNAAGLQSQALNRGIDLQTAQWLQQQGNLAPYLQAGQQGLSQLQQLAGRDAPALPGQIPTISGAGYALPPIAPTWGPQSYQGPQAPNAGDYRWNPQAGPQAQDYRYTPGQTPDAAQYASGAPQLYQGAMPGTQVPTLSGQELLAQDPGAAFRQSEARKALEGSAAARGDLLSGGTLQALQARSQDLASQEYGNAWERMMRKNTEQYGRDWGQYQQRWGEGVTGAELGLRTNAQNFGQAEAASRLREQVNQVASQQGWSQAQAEAAFREQMAQQAGAQNWSQALQGQGQAWNQGMAGAQWEQGQRQAYDQSVYDRMMQQSGVQYGRDVAQNEQDYARQQAQYRQQLAQYMLPYEMQSTLANLGGQAVGMYGNQGQNATNSIANLLGRVGEAQGTGAAGSGLMWNRALTGATNQLPSILAGLNA
jgi:hypothetical protein